MDQIFRFLADQRIFAMKEFLLKWAGIGQRITIDKVTYIVQKSDDATGYLDLLPEKGGAVLHYDPLKTVFANATQTVDPSLVGGTLTQTPPSSMVSTLGSVAPAALQGIGPLKDLMNKGKPKVLSGAGGGPGIMDKMANEIPTNVGSVELVRGSESVKSLAELHLNQAKEAANQFLDPALKLPDTPITSQWINGEGLRSANQVATQLYDNQVSYLGNRINSILSPDLKLTNPFGDLGSSSLPPDPFGGNLVNNPNPDIAKFSDPFGSTGDPSLAADPFNGNLFNSNTPNPFGTTNNSGLAPNPFDSSSSFKADLQQKYNALTSPEGKSDFIKSYLDNYKAAASKIPDLQTAYDQAAHYHDVISQVRDLPPTEGQINEAGYQLQLQGSKIKLDSYGHPDMTDPDTAAAVNGQVTINTDNQLSHYSVDQADQILHEKTYVTDANGKNMVDANGDPIIDRGDFSNYTDNTSFKNAAALKHQLLMKAEMKFGIEMGAAAVAAYGEERAIDSMFQNGFSLKAFAGAAIAAVSLAGLLHSINGMLEEGQSMAVWLTSHMQNFLGVDVGQHLQSFLHGLTGKWGFLAIQAAIIFFGWLFGRNKKSPEQQAAEQLNAEVAPAVWNPNGQVIFLTAGLTMATMGLNLSPMAPMMQTLTMTQAQATQALTNAGASVVPADGTRYADVFVKQGAPGQATQVVWLTPVGTDSKGNTIEKVTVSTLNRNLQFATSQPPTGYVPFFINGPNGSPVLNPQVAQSLTTQQHLLQCADGTWVTDASRCAAVAGWQSHKGGS